jgi:hypothetical protein
MPDGAQIEVWQRTMRGGWTRIGTHRSVWRARLQQFLTRLNYPRDSIYQETKRVAADEEGIGR